MIKNILLFAIISSIGLSSFSQKGQRIAFVDMNYILENIPAYTKAQTQLDKKVKLWQLALDQKRDKITIMQTDLNNEKALLTEDLITDREEDIVIEQLELKKAEQFYFSTNGNLFLLRKQLVTPIQDQVYNAVQEIAKVRKYDYVFDKSADLIMLYSNKSNDISELVLRSIVRGEKIEKAKRKRAAANNQINGSESNSIIEEKQAKRAASLAKVEEQKAAKAKKREEQRVAIEKKRLERLKQQEKVRSQLKTNREGGTEAKKTEDKKEDSEDRIEKSTEKKAAANNKSSQINDSESNSIIEEKEAERAAALAKVEEQKKIKAKKSEEKRAAIEKKRLERLKLREELVEAKKAEDKKTNN
ncbi:MAG: OmpH family outer membrane protein [Flavobacteriaceae bacterium]|nr:OmpH family outer membrane protein [Flavobacteriaceae bacterium]